MSYMPEDLDASVSGNLLVKGGTLTVGEGSTFGKLILNGTSSNNGEIYTQSSSYLAIDSQVNTYINIDTNDNQTTEKLIFGQDGKNALASPMCTITEGATNGADSTFDIKGSLITNTLVQSDFTITWTGFTSVTSAATCHRIGEIVYLTFASASGTSTTTGFNAANIVPVGYRPSLTTQVPVKIRNNSVYAFGLLEIGTDGTLVVYPSATGSTWTASNLKSIGHVSGQVTVSYSTKSFS